ncbi:MAG: UDP-3-O-(3-hydroxymyristoyl)glucosamine N-acyltransferase [Planctomycetes bacterium]|nr:UDP-3-O-(3-hydroxymyristoyl)glucosamine N-acyltransferase [Planctomycetota bacterium]
MKKFPLSVRQIADITGASVEGDASAAVERISAIEDAGPGDLAFAVDEKHSSRIGSCKATAALVPAGAKIRGEGGRPVLLRVPHVPAAMLRLLTFIGEPQDLPADGVHPAAVVSPDAQLGPEVRIGPFVVVGSRAKIGKGAILCSHVCIGADASIGENTLLAPGAVVHAGCEIGKNVRIGPNAVIGWDGFGYFTEKGVHHRIPHVGGVIIADDVEIGACSCVDRGKFAPTRIGQGTKIDDMVMIAHNCQLGRGCIIMGMAGLAGSVKVGDCAMIAGNAGIRDNISIGEGAMVGGHSGVAQDVPAGQAVFGMPAREAQDEIRMIMAARKIIPGLAARLKDIEARLDAIESAKND